MNNDLFMFWQKQKQSDFLHARRAFSLEYVNIQYQTKMQISFLNIIKSDKQCSIKYLKVGFFCLEIALLKIWILNMKEPSSSPRYRIEILIRMVNIILSFAPENITKPFVQNLDNML